MFKKSNYLLKKYKIYKHVLRNYGYSIMNSGKMNESKISPWKHH